MAIVVTLWGYSADAAQQREASSGEKLMLSCLTEIELAQEKGNPADISGCVGRLSEPCLEKSENHSTLGMAGCYRQETDWWDWLLNRQFAILKNELDVEDFEQLRDVQRKWIKFKDAKCRFEYDSWKGGSMAQITTASCFLHTIANQAIFLKTYVDRNKL